jgi:uncharacterized MAPEG superfamily protein
LSTELICLVWSTALGFAHICAQVIGLYAEKGVGSYDPNRDSPVVLGTYGARAERALKNFLESYPLFLALAAAVAISGRSDWLTAWGAIVYLVARVAYLPAYIGGFGPLRSTIWGVSFVGLAMMFCGVLF